MLHFQTNENHYGIKTPYKRCPFPEKWRGLAEQELVSVSGIEGAIFVHAGGFVAYALDREAAVMVSVCGHTDLKSSLKRNVFGSIRSSRSHNVCLSVCLSSLSCLFKLS